MLLTAAELKQQLADGRDIVVFDCRFSLADPQAGRAAYAAGHIPGAFYLDLDTDLSGPKGNGGGRHPLPDPNLFAAKIGACGVDPDTLVVAYDNGEGMAARAWWLLRFIGHRQAALLDGGLQAWQDAGNACTSEIPTAVGHSYPAKPAWDMVMPLSQVEAVVQGDAPGVLIDARAASRYRGENETIDPQAGHIPGAHNAPWQEGLDDAGKWRSGAEQKRRFENMLAIGSEPVVMYCGSGVTACNNLFALELAGIHGTKLYPGSWSEWSSDVSRPIATDAD